MKLLGMVVLVLVAASSEAIASPCGGSSGGSSSGSSSSSSSSSSDSSSSSTPACDRANSIVGRNQCGHFGSWDRSLLARMRFGIGLTGGTASVADMDFEGEVEHQEVHRYHYPREQDPEAKGPTMGSGGLELDASGFVSEHVSVGIFGSMEGGGSNAPDRRQNGQDLRPSGIVQFKSGAQVGLSIPMGQWTLRSDARIGVRSTGMSFESQVADCIKTSTAWNHDLLIEPRVGVERWLNPWLSAGVMVGSDIRRERDMSISIGITGHTSAFDSSRIIGLPK